LILENSTNAFRLLLSRWRLIFAVVGIVIAVEIANDYMRLDRPTFSLAAVGLIVTALSIFLVFRINESYARWWEARMLWGELVNASRSFARQATTLIREREDEHSEVLELRRDLVYRQIAFVNALRLSLRGQDDWEELQPLLQEVDRPALAEAINKPTHLLQRHGEQLAEAHDRAFLSEFGQNQLDRTLQILHNVQGSCERIKNTPFPANVAFVTRGVAWVMATVVAVAIIQPENKFDPIDMIVVPILMLGFVLMERLGAELRNPFDNEANDTPMTALCRTIERDLRQVLGERTLPPPIEPEKGVLM
jgi:putative membrane protein